MKLGGLTVADVLHVEGTDRFEVLSYLIFPARADMVSAVATCNNVFGERLDTTVCHLASSSWPAELVLVETALRDARSIPGCVTEVLQDALGSTGCTGAVCMFDGAFFSFDDLLSSDKAEQTYAFSFNAGAEVVCMSTEVLASPEWTEVVRARRRALGWTEYGDPDAYKGRP